MRGQFKTTLLLSSILFAVFGVQTVFAATGVGYLTVSVVPATTTTNSGNTITLTAQVLTSANSLQTYTYQWYNDTSGTDIAMSDTGTLTGTATNTLIETAGSMDTYRYDVSVLNTTFSFAFSTTPGTVIVVPAVSPGITVMATPMSSVIDQGQNLTLSATVTGGSGSYTYQWLNGSTPIPGATSATYKIVSASPTPTPPGGATGTFTYSVTATDTVSSQSAPSNPAGVTVEPAPVAVVTPNTTTLSQGQSVTLASSVTGGSGSFSYQWYTSNNTAIPGATSFTYTVFDSGSGDDAFYVIATDVGTSKNATPTIIAVSNGALIAMSINLACKNTIGTVYSQNNGVFTISVSGTTQIVIDGNANNFHISTSSSTPLGITVCGNSNVVNVTSGSTIIGMSGNANAFYSSSGNVAGDVDGNANNFRVLDGNLNTIFDGNANNVQFPAGDADLQFIGNANNVNLASGTTTLKFAGNANTASLANEVIGLVIQGNANKVTSTASTYSPAPSITGKSNKVS